MSKTRNKVINLSILALLLASGIVLSRFMSITTPITKIGFAFVPLMISARYLGRNEAMIVAGIGDLIGAILFPFGPYFPGYTIVEALRGFIFYKFLSKKLNWKNIFFAVVITQIVCSLILNCLCMTIFYENFRAFNLDKYIGFLAMRLPQAAIMIPVEILLGYAVLNRMDVIWKKHFSK